MVSTNTSDTAVVGCGHLDALVALTVAGAPGFAHDTLRAVASAIASSCWPLFY